MVCTEVKEPAGGIIGARGKGIATWEELKRKKTKKQKNNVKTMEAERLALEV